MLLSRENIQGCPFVNKKQGSRDTSTERKYEKTEVDETRTGKIYKKKCEKITVSQK